MLRASSPDRRHFWQAFANMAAIESKAMTSEDAQFVGRRAEEILSWHGLENLGDHVCSLVRTHPSPCCVLLHAQRCRVEQACTGPQWPITDCTAQSSPADISHPRPSECRLVRNPWGACMMLSPPALGLLKGILASLPHPQGQASSSTL